MLSSTIRLLDGAALPNCSAALQCLVRTMLHKPSGSIACCIQDHLLIHLLAQGLMSIC